MEMDLNIDNYTIPELMIVLELSDDPTQEEVNRKAQVVIDKMTRDNKHIFADFFVKARDRILEYLETLEEWQDEYDVLLESMTTDKEDMGVHSLSKIEDTLIKRPTVDNKLNPQFHNTKTRMIVINSEFVKKTDTCDFTVDLSEPLNDVLSISLYSFHIPYTWYTINSSRGNDQFQLQIDGVEDVAIVSIDSGNYSNQSISDEIHDKLSSLNPLSKSVYNSSTGKLTLTFSSEVSKVIFYDKSTSLAKENTSLGYLLGFRKTEYVRPDDLTDIGWSITGECVCTTHGTKYLQLLLDDFNRNRLNSNIMNAFDDLNPNLRSATNFDYSIERNQDDEVIQTNPRTLTQNQIYAMNQIEADRNNNKFAKASTNNSSDIFAMIPTKHHQMNLGEMCVEFGGSMQNNRRQYFGPVSLSRLHVKLVDEKGSIMDLNGNDWSFTLLCETLYQGTQKN